MNLLYWILVFLYTLLLPLHIVNTIGIGESIKLFYFPVVALSIYNLYNFRRFLNGVVLKNILKIGCLSIIPAIIFQSPFGSVVTFFLTFLTLLGLPCIEKKHIYLFSPIALLFANIISYRLSSWPGLPWRYQGLYNDPNYLVVSLIVGVFLCLKAFETFNSILIKIISIVSILFSFYIILLTQSRGGILAFILFLIIYIPQLYKKYKKITIITSLILVVFSGNLYIRFYDTVNNIVIRFSGERQSDVNGANSRIFEIEKAIDGIKGMPFYLVFGAGISASGDDESLYQNDHRIHNTPVAVVYENGLISLFLYLMIFWIQTKSLFKRDKLSCALLLALFLQSLTIWTITFMPFWLGIVLTINVIKEDLEL